MEIRECPLCRRYRPMAEMDEIVIREAREARGEKVLQRDLTMDGKEAAGMNPGRGRQVWRRCKDGVCKERNGHR